MRPEKLQEEVKCLNAIMVGIGNDLRFSLFEDEGRPLVKMINKDTKETVKVLTPHRIRQIRKSIQGTIESMLD